MVELGISPKRVLPFHGEGGTLPAGTFYLAEEVYTTVYKKTCGYCTFREVLKLVHTSYIPEETPLHKRNKILMINRKDRPTRFITNFDEMMERVLTKYPNEGMILKISFLIGLQRLYI